MTQVIIDDIIPRTQLVAAAGQTVFNTNWTVNATTDVVVYARADGVEADDETQVVSTSDYNVTLIGGSQTVRVTFLSGRTLDDVITIVRNTPADRMNLYINTNFTPSMLNEDFGILTLVDQQSQMYDTVVNPGYNVSATIANKDKVLPILGSMQAWRMNQANTAIEVITIPDGGFAPQIGSFVTISDERSDLPNSFPLFDLGNASTGGMGIPAGTTAQRVVPSSPNIGLRFNTDLNIIEAYIGGQWVEIPSSSAGLFLPLFGGTMSGNIDMDGNEINNALFGTDTDADSHKIINLATPTADDDAANKAYVDLIAAGFFFLEPVRVASTANFVATYNNGTAGVGATLTANSNGAASIDSVSLVLNDRALFKDQTSTLENGIYFVSQVGDGSTPAIYTRALDYDEPSDIDPGDMVTVLQGTANASTFWVETAVVTTIGTDPITFAQFGLSSGNFVTLSGTQTITGDKTFSGITTLDNFIFDTNQMQHVADTNNYFEFGTDTQNLVTGGSSRMDISDSGVRLGGANSRVTTILDEDNMASNSATALATQQSIKAYVDTSLDGALTPTSIQFTTTSEIIGTTTNNSAAAGSVGEVIESVIPFSSAVSMTATVTRNITSINLGTGDFDVWGNVNMQGSGYTISFARAWISSTSATLPDQSLYDAIATSNTLAAGEVGLCAPSRPFQVTGPVTVYLSAYVDFSSGTASGCGGIYARRRR